MPYNFTQAEISADTRFPVETCFCILYSGGDIDNCYAVMPRHPFNPGWGKGAGKQVTAQEHKPFDTLEVAWLSWVEGMFYYAKVDLHNDLGSDLNAADKDNFNNLIIGLGPCGQMSLWANGQNRSLLVATPEGSELDMSMNDFMQYEYNKSKREYCDLSMAECGIEPGELDLTAFKRRSRQYRYRFCIRMVGKSSEYAVKSISPAYTDGSYVTDNDVTAMSLKMASAPDKIKITAALGKSEFKTYIFFKRHVIYGIMERFYGKHPQTNTDFMINLDPAGHGIELALYRQGLAQPLPLPQDACCAIIFKNKFEHFRTDNYDEPAGAWAW